MLWNALILAMRAIRRNLMRSCLTSLGIVIGVGAVITMVTLGSGATQSVKEQIASLGSNLLIVRPGQAFRHGGVRETAPAFSVQDALAISREVSGIEAVAPTAAKGIQAIYGNKNWSTICMGTTNAFMQARDWGLEEGRPFSQIELKAGKAVCILGKTITKELFPGENPIGASIRLGKLAFRVIGVLKEKGESTFGTDRDDLVLIPLRTFHRRLAGNTDVQTIYVSVLRRSDIDKVKHDIEVLMRERRRISPGQSDDFHVTDMREITQILSGTTKVLTSLLGAVAAVSLLVGGIGIMNIMLVSVTERTREIGTRLAIGALERDVLLQFLVESMTLSSLGGIMGIVLALLASAWLARVLLVPFVFDPEIIFIAFAFSLAVGIFFGYFPAKKAAHLDPIEALRHE